MKPDHPKCTCAELEGSKEHSCPYLADINNDDSPHCTCCEYCEHECAMDI